jgi:very-short-patch-repair endonuclease
MAAVLSCGRDAVLSHESAAALWAIRTPPQRKIDVSVPRERTVRRPGIRVHRRDLAASERVRSQGIPVTDIVTTLIDLAAAITERQLEAAINEADKRDLTDPDTLRAALLAAVKKRPGIAALKRTLEEATLTLTDSDLERRFLRIAKQAGLPEPKTQARVRGYRVDFYWPDLRLVVETDGLRYHRTPSQQAKDRLRDQRLTAAGLIVLRFTHAQVAKQRRHVIKTLTAVAARS